MTEVDRRSVLALGLAVVPTFVPTAKGAAAAYSSNMGEEVAPGVREVFLHEQEIGLPGYKRIWMTDLIFRPGAATPPDLVPNDRLCVVLEGLLRVRLGEQEFVIGCEDRARGPCGPRQRGPPSGAQTLGPTSRWRGSSTCCPGDRRRRGGGDGHTLRKRVEAGHPWQNDAAEVGLAARVAPAGVGRASRGRSGSAGSCTSRARRRVLPRPVSARLQGWASASRLPSSRLVLRGAIIAPSGNAREGRPQPALDELETIRPAAMPAM